MSEVLDSNLDTKVPGGCGGLEDGNGVDGRWPWVGVEGYGDTLRWLDVEAGDCSEFCE